MKNTQSAEFEAVKALKEALYEQAFNAGTLMQQMCKHNWENDIDDTRLCWDCVKRCSHDGEFDNDGDTYWCAECGKTVPAPDAYFDAPDPMDAEISALGL